ncbi:MAG TPA: thiamine-phosphate kinase [Gemmatimonadales bacterium]|nr:thiamine-phosphate kinase [Gemmatimonadales bacterium]
MIPLGPGPEFDRIRRLVAALGPQAGPVGDDCAVLAWPGGALVLSVDLAVEGVHFRRDWLSLREIGWRATAAALSDLAAEAAVPVGLLTSLGLPAGASEAELDELARGIGAAAEAAGTAVLGGDLSRADRLIVDVVAVGRAERPVSRAGARPGDGLWVSGTLGGARAALAAFLAGREPDPEARRALAHPVPRLALGRALARAGARAMLDLSDGLGGDARHLAAASSVRLTVDLAGLPVAPAAAAEAAAAGLPPPVFAALGGEDYELLAALPPEFGPEQARAVERETGVPLVRIGEVAAGTGVAFRLDGAELSLKGYDHFA